MCAVINGEVISHDISKKQYDKYMAVDDYQRQRMMSKVFHEVDMKTRPEMRQGFNLGAFVGASAMPLISVPTSPTTLSTSSIPIPLPCSIRRFTAPAASMSSPVSIPRRILPSVPLMPDSTLVSMPVTWEDIADKPLATDEYATDIQRLPRAHRHPGRAP